MSFLYGCLYRMYGMRAAFYSEYDTLTSSEFDDTWYLA